MPLCRGYHREAHRYGDEAAWRKNAGIDPTFSARALWLEIHPLPRELKTKWALTSTTILSAVGADQKRAKRSAKQENEARIIKTKPIIGLGPNDFLQADRCHVVMLAKAPVRLRKKANTVPAAMPSVWAHGGDGDRCAAQSAVERELVLRLAPKITKRSKRPSLRITMLNPQWSGGHWPSSVRRLRRATTMGNWAVRISGRPSE